MRARPLLVAPPVYPLLQLGKRPQRCTYFKSNARSTYRMCALCSGPFLPRAGRARDTLMFTRKGERWGKSHQGRAMLDACENAKIDPPISFHVLRHWNAALLVKSGVPISFVSENLGHANPQMTVKHYGHLAPRQRADVIRAQAPMLGIVGKGNVARMRRK